MKKTSLFALYSFLYSLAISYFFHVFPWEENFHWWMIPEVVAITMGLVLILKLA